MVTAFKSLGEGGDTLLTLILYVLETILGNHKQIRV